MASAPLRGRPCPLPAPAEAAPAPPAAAAAARAAEDEDEDEDNDEEEEEEEEEEDEAGVEEEDGGATALVLPDPAAEPGAPAALLLCGRDLLIRSCTPPRPSRPRWPAPYLRRIVTIPQRGSGGLRTVWARRARLVRAFLQPVLHRGCAAIKLPAPRARPGPWRWCRPPLRTPWRNFWRAARGISVS